MSRRFAFTLGAVVLAACTDATIVAPAPDSAAPSLDHRRREPEGRGNGNRR